MIVFNNFSLYKRLLFSISRAKLLRRSIPIFVGWSITNRCNYNCQYCYVSRNKGDLELTTKEIILMIDKLSRLGTIKVNLTGGEPLIRDDIGEILTHFKKRNISVSLSTNGSLFLDKIKYLQHIDSLVLSFDGPELVHDAQREEGSYKCVIEVIKRSRSEGIRTNLYTVLTSNSVRNIDFILEFSNRFKIPVLFTPIQQFPSQEKKIDYLFPLVNDYKLAINKLIIAKKNGLLVANSLSGLKHIYNWPDPIKIKCIAGKIFYRIESNGSIYACYNLINKMKSLEFFGKKEVNKSSSSFCSSCWCANRVETNLIWSFNLDAIINAIKMN
jgi:MoaA/NifB/PqqE/SkfB family radical SAM enzyme